MNNKEDKHSEKIFDFIMRNLEKEELEEIEPPQYIFDNIIRNLEIRRGKIRLLKATLLLAVCILVIYLLLWA